ncbi:MAG: GAF domain-containing sensor histidine kinase [Anaerolineales bacterium]|nr:GAF domain-containing sensor histidine kinase [Anaerolineales bacterium]MCB0027976.1 GAF domain-containing sensor histidine kinase [Anaerolineales bacterium]MCB8962855.1 GAF domain-containing sensor histidine kinase [Ardenticatenales bacterium]
MNLGSDADQLQRRNRELANLNTIARALNQSVELEETLQTTLAQVAEVLGLKTGWIFLLDEKSGETYLAASLNLPPALVRNPQRMEGRCYCLDVYLDGDMKAAANVNVITCTRLSKLVDGTDGLRYHASIPLYAHGRQLGMLNVASPDWQEITDEDLRLLYTVGDMLGIAIERTRLYEQSVEMGTISERNRLAREIHDTLAQGLAALTLKLESADALLDSDAGGTRVRDLIQASLQLTRANLEEARRSVMDLRAAPLAGQTLPDALAALAAEGEIPVQLRVMGGNRPVSQRIAVGLYRIAQEALTNAHKHSGAALIQLHLEMTPQEIRLRIEDDGHGFDSQHIPENRFGLIGLNERARLLGGYLSIETDPGVGTLLLVTIPLREGER